MAGAAIADGITGESDVAWRLFHDNFPPRYNFWPFGRLGASIILGSYAALDELRVMGVPVPEMPRPW
jgi:hypothetical protein